MAKRLQEAEELIARLQAASQIANDAASSSFNAFGDLSTPTASTSQTLVNSYTIRSEQTQNTTNGLSSILGLSSEEKPTQDLISGELLSDLSLDAEGKICYYGPTSAVHDPPTPRVTEPQDVLQPAKSDVRSLLASKAMESRAWEEFSIGNAASRTDIPRATISDLLSMHWSWIAPMFMWVYRPAFMRNALAPIIEYNF